MIVSSASPLFAIVAAYSRCSASSAVSSSRPLIPMIAFIGVRISWLVAARNALLACVRLLGRLARLLRLAEQAGVLDRDAARSRRSWRAAAFGLAEGPPRPCSAR